jgi:hypothetical protein
MIALFVLKLATGIALMWLLMPRRDVADGFFRIQMLVVLGLTVLLVLAIEPAALTGFGRNGPGAVSERELALAATGAGWLRKLAFAAAAVAWPGHIFWKLGRRIPGTLSIWLIGLTLSAALAVQAVTSTRSVPLWQQLLADVGTAGVLGSVLTAMLLGHWYLTTPTMSLQPLRWFCPVLAGAAAVRLAATAAGLLEIDFEQLDLIRCRCTAGSQHSAVSQYAVGNRSVVCSADSRVYGRNVGHAAGTRLRSATVNCARQFPTSSGISPIRLRFGMPIARCFY